MPILTNNHWRQFKYRNEVPDAILADQFEHLDADEGFDQFFQYKRSWYHLSDFMRLEDSEWQGACGICNTASVVIRVSQDAETYQIGLAT